MKNITTAAAIDQLQIIAHISSSEEEENEEVFGIVDHQDNDHDGDDVDKDHETAPDI